MRSAMARGWVAGLLMAVAGMPAKAGDWFTVETEHFTITTDGPKDTAQDYVKKLEAFRHLSLLTVGADPASARAQAKFDIHLLKSRDEMLKVRPGFASAVSGAYFQCVEGSSAYSSLTYREFKVDDSDRGLEALFHEYAHHVMFQYARAFYPQWYVEGFAEYMSTAYVGEGSISLGHDSPDRLRLLHKDRWIGFDRVLKPSFTYAGDKANDEWEILSFYAQSWLLTHYMLSDSERTKRFNDYFARVGAGEDPIAAFEPATGIAVGSLKRTLKRYMDNMEVIKINMKDLPGAAIRVQAVDDANDHLFSASLLKTCMPRSQGEAILAQLRAARGSAAGVTPAMRLALDRAEILFGDVKVAIDDLKAQVSADEASFEAQYLLGRAWMKSATQLEGAARTAAEDQARAAFFKAYRLKKLDAPNLYFLSQSLSTGGVNANALNAARVARSLSPAVTDYAVHEAWLDLQAGERERAVAALMPLASNPHDQKQASRMRDAIEAIKAGKGQADVSHAMKGDD